MALPLADTDVVECHDLGLCPLVKKTTPAIPHLAHFGPGPGDCKCTERPRRYRAIWCVGVAANAPAPTEHRHSATPAKREALPQDPRLCRWVHWALYGATSAVGRTAVVRPRLGWTKVFNRSSAVPCTRHRLVAPTTQVCLYDSGSARNVRPPARSLTRCADPARRRKTRASEGSSKNRKTENVHSQWTPHAYQLTFPLLIKRAMC